ncbi:MAG TPA: NAD-dependent epimerase/dehydratase family protein, partial [Bryobacteraceae bacterium]|nr:NAD-dependent epimerase/dehydratase family protein [Bryobacteraceae bacterium]
MLSVNGKPRDFWIGRRVLLTGATGLMGSWLLDSLLEQGADVVALVRDYVPQSIAWRNGLLERVTVCHGSLEDLGLLRRALAEYSIDTIFHLAAQPLVGVAKLEPAATLDVNIRGSWHVLEAARLCGTRQVV